MSHKALGLCFVLAAAVTGCGGGGDKTTTASAAAPIASAARTTGAPATAGGVRGPQTDPARVGPLTLDFSDVQPAGVAEALGRDPARIFAYVRDQIAFESYRGCLRGPRGTLLAMAGNDVDRSALLAALLESAGQKVRFARGHLSDADARALVMSMWAERPAANAAGAAAGPAAARPVATALNAAVQRDYGIVRAELKKAKIAIPATAAPSLDVLVKDAQDHVWIQWSNGGAWLDLDPSKADAAPGRAYAPVSETFDHLPARLFHRVDVRLRIEEYTGATATTREVLRFAAVASDLSGANVVLSHQPENWKGPAASLEQAMATVFEATGRLKPVLIAGDTAVIGKPFRLGPPGTVGMSSLRDLLGGAGTRHDVPIAVAEWLVIDAVAPDGRTATVEREVFDLIGRARRKDAAPLAADEIAQRAAGAGSFDLTAAIYSLSFQTGGIARAYVASAAPPSADEAGDVTAALRHLARVFEATSDALTARFSGSSGAPVRLYFDSPRVTIVEFAKTQDGAYRVAIDLRRDTAQAVSADQNAENAFFSRVARGVVDGALERAVLDYVAAASPGHGARVRGRISTSALFEIASSRHVPTLLMQSGLPSSAGLSADALARLDDDLKTGGLVIAPDRGIEMDGVTRLAWWHVNPQSGDTVAVADDGLHASEVMATWRDRADGVRVVAVYYVGVFGRVLVQEFDPATFEGGLAAIIRFLIAQGIDRDWRPW